MFTDPVSDLYARVYSMHVLWKIFGVSFELLAHNHVEVGAQVFSFGGWRSMKSLSETLSINNRLVIGFLVGFVEKCFNFGEKYNIS
jgi:hypothetical protein